MKIEVIKTPTKVTKKALQEYLAECVSVVRDKEPKSAEKLWDRLLKESVGGKPSRVFEYIPCTLPSIDYMGSFGFDLMQAFGFVTTDGKYHTNARELLNVGCSIKEILQYTDFTNYVAFKCETPYFIYGQVSTHTQLTTVSHSQRYADCDRGFWKPPEVGMSQDEWDKGIDHRWRRWELRKVMKDAGITRKEVFDRGSDMLQNRVFTIGGYTNNPNAWSHFIKQRLDNHTQLETREFVKLFDEHFEGKV